jgi:hypothetical protein
MARNNFMAYNITEVFYNLVLALTLKCIALNRYLIACLFFFFVVSWGGVGLSPLGTSAAIWFILPAPDER